MNVAKKKVVKVEVRGGVVDVLQIPSGYDVVLRDYDCPETDDEDQCGEDEGGSYTRVEYGDIDLGVDYVGQVVLTCSGGCCEVETAPEGVEVDIQDFDE